MTILDPKPPLRHDLEELCGGNQRLVKAFEKLFELIPKELNNSNDLTFDIQLTADFARSSANQANAEISNMVRLIELATTSPAPTPSSSDPLGVTPRYEVVHSDPILPVYQGEICPNYYLEVM